MAGMSGGGLASGGGGGSVTNTTGTAPIAVANGTTAPVISVADADATHSGVVNLSAQTLGGGVKTFSSVPVASGLTAPAATALTHTSSVADGGSAVAQIFNNTTSLVTTGAKIASFRNNGTEEASIGSDGTFTGPVSIVGGVAPVALANPGTPSLSTGTGTLSTATYYYTMTAMGAGGETSGTAETSLAITGPAGVTLTWVPVQAATSYKIYGRSIGLPKLIATVSGGSSTTYTDDGSITPGVALVGSPAAAIYMANNSRMGWGATSTTPYSSGYVTGSSTTLDLIGGSAGVRIPSSLLTLASNGINGASGAAMLLTGRPTDGASAVGTAIDTNTTLANATAKLFAVRNNSTEKFSIDLNGKTLQVAGDSTASPGAATLNTPTGVAKIAAGAASVVITNSTVTATSLVQAWVQQVADDVTLLYIKRVSVSAGSFTIVGNIASTADVTVAFRVMN